MTRGGLGAVLRLQLRTGWVAVVAWVAGLLAAYVGTVAAIDTTYGTPEQLATYGATVGSDPTMAAINGTPYGADTLGGVVANEFGFIAAIAVPLMGLLLVSRFTRKAEELGLLELVRSRAVGARAPWSAALLVAGGALVLLGAGAAVTLVLHDVPVPDAALYGASLTALGLVFAGVATLAGQLLRRSAGVVGAGIVVLGAAYVLRAVGDVKGNGWKWLSPLAWQQETRPFADSRVWPLLLALGVFVALTVAGLVLVGRRDLGSAAVASRPGPARAGRFGRSQVGLALRLHGPVLLAWAAGAAVVGAVFGAFTDDVDDVIAGNPDLQALFSSGADGADAASWYVSFCLVLVLLMAMGAGAQVIGRVRAEETGGRLEPLLARSTSRTSWIATHAAVALTGSAVVAIGGGAGLAATVAGTSGDTAGTIGATVAYLPAVLVLPALGVALVGLVPRGAVAMWAALAYVALVEMLGETLRLPDWALQVSPLHATGRLPTDEASGVAVAVISAVVVALVVAGTAGFRHRDVPR